MTTHKTYIRVLAALFASELCISFHPPENQRAQGRPGARRTRGPVCKNCAKSAHGNNHRQGGITPAFPAQWFTAYFGLSPVNQLVCHRRRPRCVSIAAGLTPAWARQDHTTSPSAKDAVRRSAHPRPPQPASRVVTIAIRPSAIEAGCTDNTANPNFWKEENLRN
jgi:hypothetical protein